MRLKFKRKMIFYYLTRNISRTRLCETWRSVTLHSIPSFCQCLNAINMEQGLVLTFQKVAHYRAVPLLHKPMRIANSGNRAGIPKPEVRASRNLIPACESILRSTRSFWYAFLPTPFPPFFASPYIGAQQSTYKRLVLLAVYIQKRRLLLWLHTEFHNEYRNNLQSPPGRAFHKCNSSP